MKPSGSRASTFAWLIFATLCFAYVAARSSSLPALLAASQLIFLVVVFSAALFTLEAYRVGPPGDERRMWGLLSISAWLLAASESYRSWYQSPVGPAGPSAQPYSDWLSLAAASMFLVLLGLASGLARRELLVRFRFLADAVAVMVLSLMVLFRLWSAAPAGQVGWELAVRWAVYSFYAIAMFGSVVWLWFGFRRAGRPGRVRYMLVGLSIALFALGIIFVPFVHETEGGSAVGNWVLPVTGITFMAGYSLMATAAVMRVQDRRQPWQSRMSRPPGAESELTTGVMSLLVLIAVGLAAIWAYQASSITEGTVYLVMGVVATLAMVARTAVISLETQAVRDSVGRDAVTGVGSLSAFHDRLETAMVLVRRSGEPFVLAILNLDDFAGVNEVLGRSAGDQVLVQVSDALQAAVGKRSEVFRLQGDSFAVIAPGFGERDRLPIGSDLLAAVSSIDLGWGLTLSASVGVVADDEARAVADDEASVAGAELEREADAAQVWAKYHGKGRVVVHDERIVHALGAEERLRLSDARLHYDLARALAASADARDSRSAYHSRNVAALSVLLGEATGLNEDQVRTLEIAAMLHDVGQIALPDELVVGPLTPSRRLAAREHTVLGAQLVESVGASGASAAVRGHHERWDGLGYPDALSGEGIALESRIIALADAYDGMTSGRRSGISMSRAAALQEIDHALGTRFDPALAEAFIRLVGTTSSLGWSDEWAVPQ